MRRLLGCSLLCALLAAAQIAPSNQQIGEIADFVGSLAGAVLRTTISNVEDDPDASVRLHPDIGRSTVSIYKPVLSTFKARLII
jgi:hypothetical protein